MECDKCFPKTMQMWVCPSCFTENDLPDNLAVPSVKCEGCEKMYQLVTNPNDETSWCLIDI